MIYPSIDKLLNIVDSIGSSMISNKYRIRFLW